MTKNQRFGLIFFFIMLIAAYLVTTEPWKKSSKPAMISIQWNNLASGYPLAPTTDTILSYEGFDLGYNEKFEQAAWVAYVLTREEAESGAFSRKNNFRPDPSIITGSASLADYRASGFDRGHLAPAGDMTWSKTAMSQSFFMSNMSPQLPAFNRGVWRRLETRIRNWAIEKDSLFVITGPLFTPGDSLIGLNGVGVPTSYFKVLVDLSPPDHDMIAFVLPNAGSKAELSLFALTVDSLEMLSGYDFFYEAPDQDVIEWLEQQMEPGNWN